MSGRWKLRIREHFAPLARSPRWTIELNLWMATPRTDLFWCLLHALLSLHCAAQLSIALVSCAVASGGCCSFALASRWLLLADALAAVEGALAAVMATARRLLRCCESFSFSLERFFRFRLLHFMFRTWSTNNHLLSGPNMAFHFLLQLLYGAKVWVSP